MKGLERLFDMIQLYNATVEEYLYSLYKCLLTKQQLYAIYNRLIDIHVCTCSQRTMTMSVGVIARRYQHHKMECNKHCHSPLTNEYGVSCVQYTCICRRYN